MREGAPRPDVLREAEPPVPPGMIRLYRGETAISGERPVPDYVRESPEYQATVAATGRWFTRDRAEAEHYAEVHGADKRNISYVDVPQNEVEQYLSANQPEARRFSAAGREGTEYFVPPEIAAARRPLPAPARPDVLREAPAPAAPQPRQSRLRAADDVMTAARDEGIAYDPTAQAEAQRVAETVPENVDLAAAQKLLADTEAELETLRQPTPEAAPGEAARRGEFPPDVEAELRASEEMAKADESYAKALEEAGACVAEIGLGLAQ
jgi:hypothetical protein